MIRLKLKGYSFIFFLLLALGGVGAYAQGFPHSYKALSSYIQQQEIDSLELESLDKHLRTLNQENTDSLLSHVFPSLEQVFQDRPVVQKARLYDLLTAAAYQLTGNLSYTRQYVDKGIYYYEKSGDHFRSLWAQTQRMFILADADSVNTALKVSLVLQERLEQSDFDPGRKSALYQQLCLFYSTIQSEEYGIEFCNKGLRFNKEHDLVQGNARLYETLAVLSGLKGAKEQDIIALQRKAICSALAEGDSFSLRVIYRNMADTYMQLNLPDSVNRYFGLTFQLYESHPYFFGWFTDQIVYAEFLIKQERLSQAGEIIEHLEENFTGNSVNLAKDYYQLREKYAVNTCDVNSYSKWSAKYDSIVTIQSEEERVKVREEMTVKYETEKKESENKLLKAKSRSRFIQILALLGLVILLIIIVMLVVQRRKRDREIFAQKQRFKELELDNERKEKQLMTNRNEELKKDLSQRIKQVVEQQVINADLMEMVEELRTTDESPLVRKKAAQMKVQLVKSIQGQVFENIYTKMLELHPHLLQYLSKELGPDKEAELVSTAMYFLGYESSVIAKVLNRSEKAIRNMRHRVRQKLGMESKDDFVEFLHRINKDLPKA